MVCVHTEPRTVFIGGVHGVGKTTLSLEIDKLISSSAISASTLISRRKEIEKTKATSQLTDNQKILIQELGKFKKLCDKSYILLDGHFCLYDESLQVVRLSTDLYKKIEIDMIICLHCDIVELSNRLKNRDKSTTELSLSQLKILQDEEIKHANGVANALDIPITFVDTSDIKNNNYLEDIVNHITAII